MATGYEKINLIKSKLKTPMSVTMLAEALGCSPRTVFRHLDVIEEENCGLRKIKREGETRYVIQVEEQANFNQTVVRQLEKIKKNLSSTSAADIKTTKLLDKVISALQTTDPDEFKPEAISTDPDYVLDYGPFCDNKLQDSMVNRALKAIHEGFALKMRYRHSTSEAEIKTIEVFPVKVIMRMDTLYLVAASLNEDGDPIFKNYMFENIENMMETNHSSPKLSFDAKVHYMYAFGKYTDEKLKPEDISLEIRNKWLQTQFERSHFYPEVSKRFDRNKNMVVDMKLRVTPDFENWLMGNASDIRILKPASLREKIKQKMKKALAEMDG
jgi:predicted DNA-binding transcriptional regulator YafY